MEKGFQVREKIRQPGNLKEIILEGAGQSVRILPEMGSNLYSYSIEGQELLMEAEDITEKGVKYGIPILFPTPNRVNNGMFVYNGKKYPQVKNGEKRLIHGLVCDEVWEYGEMKASEEEASVSTWIEVQEGDSIYEAFPFPFLLKMTYRLQPNRLTLEYQVENRGNEALPFGFALHPFFRLVDSREDIYIKVPIGQVMEAFECMPTGKILPVQDTDYDLNTARPLEALNLDDVYWKMEASRAAKVEYRKWGKELKLQASDDFTHMVVYTPKHRPCFCLENQTCSTDAHNLFAQGREDVSGLIILEAGQNHRGEVAFTIA